MQSDLFSLKGKTALVAGASGILGPVFSDALGRYGANIALVDINEPGDLSASLSESYNIKAQSYAFDVCDHKQMGCLIDAIEEELGPIDVLHFNAASKGGSLEKFFARDEEYDLDFWRDIMNVNLDSAFVMAMEVGKRMASRQGGSIIMTGSIYGIMAPDQRIYDGSEYLGRAIRSPAVYSASKAGLTGLARHLAAMWGSNDVRVNVLVPGGVSSGQNDVFEKKYSNRIPMARMAKAEEMAGALIFLASDASSYVTGQVIAIDGGLSCW